MTANPFEGFERRRGELARHAENSARLAYMAGTFTTTGLGPFAFSREVRFGTPFIERPIVAYGYVFLFDDDDDITVWPRSVGFVWDWNQNAKGQYTGASCAVCVDTPVVVTPTPEYPLEHHFSFSGLAIKGLPANLLDD